MQQKIRQQLNNDFRIRDVKSPIDGSEAFSFKAMDVDIKDIKASVRGIPGWEICAMVEDYGPWFIFEVENTKAL